MALSLYSYHLDVGESNAIYDLQQQVVMYLQVTCLHTIRVYSFNITESKSPKPTQHMLSSDGCQQ